MKTPIARDKPLTMRFSPEVPCLYVYLRDLHGFKVAFSRRIGLGLILDFDSRRKLVGIELLDPAAIDTVFRKIPAQYGVPQLNHLKSRKRALKELLAAG